MTQQIHKHFQVWNLRVDWPHGWMEETVSEDTDCFSTFYSVNAIPLGTCVMS